MSRYIDAEKAMERERMAGNCRKCKHYISSLKECAGGAEMTAVCHFLTYTHGADVAPVRHGKWEVKPTLIASVWLCRCSACGHKFSLNGSNRTIELAYCPWCGARMDNEEE